MNSNSSPAVLLIPFVMSLGASLGAIAVLAGCAAGDTGPVQAVTASPTSSARQGAPDATAARLAALPTVDVLLLGEQHDSDDHHRIEAETASHLAARGSLAALAMEMAEQGRSTAGLPPSADESAVKSALGWNDKAWPWAAYGPVAMAAVRAGVPVLGANLPRDAMRAAMADGALDGRLPGPALKAQQQAIRTGHCNMLPESQITPMTRVQIARDRAMADTLVAAVRPGKTVLLVAGAGHVDRALGVPQHLPPALRVAAVKLQAGEKEDRAARFDSVWVTPALAEKDYCAGVGAGPAK